MDNKTWFKNAKFGMMIHWGLYSLPAGEWKGKRMEDIGEWAQQYFRIPNAEYHKLASVFNPILFDAEEWVKLAKDAGMQYMVFTAKHHEGFAMYHSKVSKFNIVDATPFGRDVLAELAEACYKHGLKLGLYYSQDLDWSEPNGGDYTSTGDNEIPDDDKSEMLYETPATLNDTWGYKSFDNNWKSAERVRAIKDHLNTRGINYLLNVGPDYLGRIPAPAADILRHVNL